MALSLGNWLTGDLDLSDVFAESMMLQVLRQKLRVVNVEVSERRMLSQQFDSLVVLAEGVPLICWNLRSVDIAPGLVQAMQLLCWNLHLV